MNVKYHLNVFILNFVKDENFNNFKVAKDNCQKTIYLKSEKLSIY
jgi:hypothetical protein